MKVTLGEDGKSISISGRLPKKTAKAIAAVAKQHGISFEEAMHRCLTAGAHEVTKIKFPADGQHRRSTP